jgi:multiple antibiotic resistance protein
VILPILLVGLACWLSFRLASHTERQIRRSTLDVVERIGGFILAAMAIEMTASGLRQLFPLLSPAQ